MPEISNLNCLVNHLEVNIKINWQYLEEIIVDKWVEISECDNSKLYKTIVDCLQWSAK